MGNEIITETSFSHFNIYAPLEKYVRNFAKNNGFNDLDDFSKNMILGKNHILDFISVDNIKELSAIGLLFQGIHQENNLNDFGLKQDNIFNAIQFLKTQKRTIDKSNTHDTL